MSFSGGANGSPQFVKTPDNVGMARCIHKEVYKELLHVLVGPENDFGVSALSAAQVRLKLRQSFDKDTGIYILHLPG